MRMRWLVLLLLTLAGPIDGTLWAQVVRGTLLQPDSVTPAAGVIVTVSRTANDSVLARTITGDRGGFSLTVVEGAVRLRALRIGYRPHVIGDYTLAARETRDVRAVLPNLPIVLATVTTKGTTSCTQKGAAGEAVAAAFEEARKALLSTQLRSSDGVPIARYSLYTAARSVQGRELSPIERRFFEGESSRPFQSVPPDSLARAGYVIAERDGTVYRAPDADVLLSDSFAASHCLELAEGEGAQAAWVGIAFRPAQLVRGIVDVRGTLWLDRRTSELRRLEFAYAGLPALLQYAKLGGLVEYTRLANGIWFASRWEIRMPRTTFVPQRGVQVSGIEVTGGEVWRMRRGDDLLYTNGEVETSNISATVVEPRRGAASADTLTTLAECASAPGAAASAMILGVVRDGQRAPVVDAVVTAEWQEEFQAAGARLNWMTRRLTTTTSADGFFSMCGLPRARLVTMGALFGARRAPTVAVRIGEKEGTARVELRMGAARETAGVSHGVVVRVRDVSGRAVPYALVEVENGRGRVTDDSGRVMLSAAPDSLRIRVRRIGFTPFDERAGRDRAGEFAVPLVPLAQSLGAVTVSGRASSPLENAGFYDRVQRAQRGAFNADFITPEELDARPGVRLTDLFQGRRFVFPNRAPGSRPQTYLMGRGGCKMSVYLDGRLLTPDAPGGSAFKTDIKTAIVPLDDIVGPGEVAAIEIYASAANAPAELIPLVGAAQQGSCGIVAIWTGARR